MDKVFIDLGAYTGRTIETFCTQMPDAAEYKIYAWEPHPACFAGLVHKCFMDRIDNVRYINAMAGTHNGTTSLYVGRGVVPDGSTMLPDKRTGGVDYEHPMEVLSVDIAQWLTDTVPGKVALKLNIEGGEYVVLSHLMARGLMDKIAWLNVSWHSHKFCEAEVDKYRKTQAEIIDAAKSAGVVFAGQDGGCEDFGGLAEVWK